MSSNMSMKRKIPASIHDDSPGTKRSRVSEAEELGEDPASSPSESPKATNKYPRSDPVFGQKHAFPGLDDNYGDELFYGPPEDGLEYLRMVRSEARTLPAIFISQERLLVCEESVPEGGDGYEEDTGEIRSKGSFSNGVYVAPPVASDSAVHPEPNDNDRSDPQEIYYNLLRHRFLLLRSTLKCMPPAEAIAALDSQHPISFLEESRKARSEWRWLLQTVEPRMVQIACMDPESVLRVITVVTRSISDAVKSGEVDRVKRLAAWAWGLLGRCREVGEMGSEEVADIRELGKRAAKILTKIREAEVQDYPLETQPNHENDDGNGGAAGKQGILIQPEIEGNNDNDIVIHIPPEISPQIGAENDESLPQNSLQVDGAPVSEEDELEAAKARLWARLASTFSDENPTPDEPEDGIENTMMDDVNRDHEDEVAAELRKETRAMLDMIISIVGEFYGQRDLLEERDIWKEGDEGW